VISSVGDSKGKKTEDQTMMWPLGPKPNLLAVADLPEAQALTPARIEQSSDILTNSKIRYRESNTI
jgi:hypothetical protein